MLPWKCKEDLKLFKSLTLGQKCLVGYNTFINLPKLKDRELILDKRGVELITEPVDWCIGGAKTYEKYCHLFTELHISIIDNNSTGDTIFPNLQNLNKDCKIIFHYFSEDK
jgi:dihydrofolate reductase